MIKFEVIDKRNVDKYLLKLTPNQIKQMTKDMQQRFDRDLKKRKCAHSSVG